MPETHCISACLLGHACRYDGASREHANVLAQVQQWRSQGHRIVAVCPEQLGGLGTPRPPAELRGGDGAAVWQGQARVVRLHDLEDVTTAFQRGALAAAQRAEQATSAVLKARSPSCGVGLAHQDGEPRSGDGVFASLLRLRGVALFTEQTLPPVLP